MPRPQKSQAPAAQPQCSDSGLNNGGRLYRRLVPIRPDRCSKLHRYSRRCGRAELRPGKRWVRLSWFLGRLRWERVTLHLAKVRVLPFAIRHKLRIDLRQRLASSAWLRRSPHDWRDAIHKNPFAGLGTAPNKARLLAGRPDFGARRITWRSLRGDDPSQTTMAVGTMKTQYEFRCIIFYSVVRIPGSKLLGILRSVKLALVSPLKA